VTACGQPGYWFFPAGVFSEGVEFELVVEGRASEVCCAQWTSTSFHG